MIKQLLFLNFLVALSFLTTSLYGQSDPSHEVRHMAAPDMTDICQFDPTDINSFHYVRHFDVVGKSADTTPSSDFQVDYRGPNGEGEEIWPAEAIAAFEYATSIWETHIQSSVPIRVNALWDGQEGNTLGSAGPTQISTVPTAAGGEPETWYAIAQASAMTGIDRIEQIAGVEYDINVTMNSNFADWYFGTDENTPQGQIDFVTVVLHELGHGIGFIGSVSADEEIAEWGFGGGDNPTYPIIYDRPVVDGDQNQIINESVYTNPSTGLYQAVTGDRGGVFFAGDVTRQVYLGADVPLYAPEPWQPGSSYSHLDLFTFTNTENELMRPQINRANAVHTPGPVFCGMLDDWGWPLGDNCLDLVGIESRIVVDTQVLDFGVSNVGSTTELTFTIENREDAEDPLNGRVELENGNDYSIIGGARSFSIEPGNSEVFTVRYRPGTPTANTNFPHTDEVLITHNARNEDSPLIINLEGESLEENRVIALEQTYPNPIIPNQNILSVPYILRDAANVKIDLYNSTGQHIATIFDGMRDGDQRYIEEFDIRDLASGVYLYRIMADGAMEARKLTIIK